MRVAVSTVGTAADDPRTWSGTPAGIVGAMRRFPALDTVVVRPPAPRVHLTGRVLSYATKRLPGAHKVNWESEPAIVARMTDALFRDPSTAACNAVLALGWMPLRSGKVRPPLAVWNDSTYAQRVDASPHWRGLGRRTRRMVERTEGAALRNADALVMASRWAANDALHRYDLDPTRVHVVPLGANIERPEPQPRVHPGGPLRLLAIGVEWHRKGMDIAVRCADELRRRGREVELDIVGISPPGNEWQRDNVRYHGFVSKRDPTGAAVLDDLYRHADVFVFPTRDEPYGVVLAEAAAYSLPVVAPALNAIPEIVEDGVTGLLVPPADGPAAYADAIEGISGPRYEEMARRARLAFGERLNWDSAVRSLADVLRSVVG